MALNIKNDSAERLARELAELTGESLTLTVTVAVRERLERVRRQDPEGVQRREERILFLGRDIAEAMGSGGLRVDDLYDEQLGLPV